MVITIGSLTLNEHISRRQRFNNIALGFEKLTLGGKIVSFRLIGDSSDIVLEAIEENNIRKGYFLKSQLEQLEAYKRSGQVVVLSYHGELNNVVVRHDGINVEKVLWSSEDSSDEKYIGSIGLKIIT